MKPSLAIRAYTQFLVIGIVVLFFSVNVRAASGKTVKNISDTLCVITPAAAVLSSLALEEPKHTSIYVLELMSQELFVEGIKHAFHDSELGERPSDVGTGGGYGTISSHVSATTSGAIKLWDLFPDNYWVKGLSAASVGFVSFQRVDGDHHTPLQVGLGIGTAFLFDYMGDRITEYLAEELTTAMFLSAGTGNTPKFTFSLPEFGDGLVATLNWRF